MSADDDVDWSSTTFEGSRRAQLRRWLRLTVRERLEAVEQLSELGRLLAERGAAQRDSTGSAGTLLDPKPGDHR